MKSEFKIIADIITENSRVIDVGCDDGTLMEFLKKNNEGYLSPKSHYYNFRNHIIFLRKHKSDFNSLGIVIFQILKITLFSSYFILRFRKKKLINLWKGVYDGLRVKI